MPSLEDILTVLAPVSVVLLQMEANGALLHRWGTFCGERIGPEGRAHDHGEFATVALFENLLFAREARELLDAAGIFARIPDEHMLGVNPFYGPALHGIGVGEVSRTSSTEDRRAPLRTLGRIASFRVLPVVALTMLAPLLGIAPVAAAARVWNWATRVAPHTRWIVLFGGGLLAAVLVWIVRRVRDSAGPSRRRP
jgi:hypothetical protein